MGAPERVSVTVNATFRELLLAGLTLVRYQGLFIVFHAIFPLAGVAMIVLILLTGRSLRAIDVFMILLAFSFTPLVLSVSIWSARRRNKLTRGPFTYSFDSEGMHISGETFSSTIKWPAIPRVRRSKRFLFVFISPTAAHAIPLRALSEQAALDSILSIAARNTDFR